MTTERPPEESSTAEPCPICPLLRKRLHDVEEAAENYIEVILTTGDLRVEAHKKLVAALTTDVKTAILAAHDFSDVDRKLWLDQSEQHEAAQSTEAQS